MAQMKEKIKTPEKELSNEGIVNLLDAELKTLESRMLREMIEYSCKIKEEVKARQSEIKRRNSEERKPGLTSTIWNKMKK